MIVNDIKYNFDRILRVTVSANEGSQEKQFVIEYCPMADERLNARIDVTEKEVPIVNSKHNGPGFSAKVRIYNPPVELVGMINQHAGWSLQNKNLKSYYAGRCWVTIDAGYWDSQKAANAKKLEGTSEIDEQNKKEAGRDYNRIFGGWLNTSAYYRKGVDNILEMFCHSIRILDSENQEMINSVSAAKSDYARVAFQEKTESPAVGSEGKSWDRMMREIITQYAQVKSPKNTWGILRTDKARNASLAPVDVQPSDRTDLNKFYYLNYIYEPSNLSDIEGVKRADKDLQRQAQEMNTKGYVINGKTFYEKIQEMCDRFPGLRWHEDLTYDDGYSRYYFWRQPGGSGRAANTTKRTLPSNAAPDVVIYNFQNFLQVPSVDGAGCFTIKMLFNPNIKPNNKLMLKWVDELTHNGVISPLTKGVSSTAQIGQYYPSLQGGVYNAQVAAILNTNGDLFNVSYTVAYITHTLSTHSASWSTEVKTTSVALRPKGS